MQSQKRIRPLFALLALSLTALACSNLLSFSKGRVVCTLSGRNTSLEEGAGYNCGCGNGPSTFLTERDLNSLDNQSLEQLVCVDAPKATATATTTPIPTDTPPPSALPAAPALQPYLSGAVTVCNLTKSYINFVIDPNAPDLTGKTYAVTINNIPANCAVASNNSEIFSCAIPQNTTFPADIILTVDGTELNNISFDGGICTTTAPIPEGNNDEPAATEPPATDPPLH